MTTPRFRQLVKRLSKEPRSIQALRTVLEARQRNRRRYSKCQCGTTIDKRSKRCNLHSRRKPIALVT